MVSRRCLIGRDAWTSVTSNQWLPTLRSAQSAARKALAEIRDDEDRAHAVKAFAAHGAKYHKVAPARGQRL